MRAIGLVVVLCVLAAEPAAGELRIFEYRAVVGAVSLPFEPIASLGDPAFGRIAFDSEALDTDPDPAVGRYPGALHEFTIGSYAGSSTQSFVRIVDDGSLPAYDSFQVVDPAPGGELGAVAGIALSSVVLAIYASPDLYAGDALPLEPPALADGRVFDAFVSLSVLPPGSDEPTPLFADLHTLPEPAGASGAALLAVLALGRPRRANAAASSPDPA